MSAATSPAHESLPLDDRLYRVWWAGEVFLPSSASPTPRFRMWLREVEDSGQYKEGGAYIEVAESVGSIPRFAIGSFWRNRRQIRTEIGRNRAPERIEIQVDNLWTVDSASKFINRADRRLKFATENGKMVSGHQAWVVRAFTTDGKEIVIPSYEIFRCFYGGTTDLALKILSGRWSNTRSSFMTAWEQTNATDGFHWHVDLEPGVPQSAVPYLAWLSLAPGATAAADSIYTSLSAQRQAPVNLASKSAWISARPPIATGPLSIRAITEPLPIGKATLVTQILAFTAPPRVVELSYTVPEQRIPSERQQPERDLPNPVEKGRPPNNPSVTKPGPRRKTRRYHTLPGVAMRWGGLPVPKRGARDQRGVPLRPSSTTTAKESTPNVSTGTPTNRPAHSAGQFTPEEEITIEDRFQLLSDLLEGLRNDEHIDDYKDYPLVFPAPESDPRFCEFRTEDKDGPLSWTIIRHPRRRYRLALVVEVHIGHRLVYWIETESINRKYSSLAVEMPHSDSLDEANLTVLLDLCAHNAGVWPKKEIEAINNSGRLFAARAVHTKISEGQLSPNVVLNALARLLASKTAYENQTAGAEPMAIVDELSATE